MPSDQLELQIVCLLSAECIQKANIAASHKQKQQLLAQQQELVSKSQPTQLQPAVSHVQQPQHQRSNSGLQHQLGQQSQQLGQQSQQLGQVSQGSGGSYPEQFIHAELIRLQLENERLKREMEKVAQRELMLTQLLNKTTGLGAGGAGAGGAQGGGGNSFVGSVVGVDAFLGQVSKPELHARQSSNDSGLGKCLIGGRCNVGEPGDLLWIICIR